MKTNIITAVGIDVSKAKSTVAARRPGGEVALIKNAWQLYPYTLLQTPSQNGVKRTGYRFGTSAAERIHAIARNAVATLPKNDSTKLLITQAANSLNAVYDSLQMLRNEMNRLALLLPKYDLVMSMEGVGQITGPQLMAEIGDIRRFSHKGTLLAYAGVDAPPFQSGTFDAKNRHVSKRGSPHLRKVLFEIASMILVHSNMDNPVFRFMDKK